MTPSPLRRQRRLARTASPAFLEPLESRTLMSTTGLAKALAAAAGEIHALVRPRMPGHHVAVPAPGAPAAPEVPPDPISTSIGPADTNTIPPAVPPVVDPVVPTDLDTLPSLATLLANQPIGAASNSGNVYADPRADLNGDGFVDLLDFTKIANHWLQTGTPGTVPGDANGDGVVNALDTAIVAANWQLPVAPQNSGPPVAYDWHAQTINGVVNLWAPNPSDFGTTFTVTDPNALFGADGVPQLTSIHQGPIADCYVLAAEASLAAENPSKLRSIVQNDPGGGWAVTFQYFDNTQHKYVPFTIHTDDELSSSLQTEENGEVWNLVIEKAYAVFRTWNGSTSLNTMASLNYGYVGNMMIALGEQTSVLLTTGLTKQQLYTTLQADLAQNLAIDMHTSSTAPTMVASHVYAIIGVQMDGNGTIWVTTYNPWGFYDTRTIDDLLLNGIGSLVVGTTT